MTDHMGEAEALRNAARALDALNKASPLTRRRVTNILHTYNASIERKIERLNTMLHHDATELFVMASNEAALPFRAVHAETRRMFAGAAAQPIAKNKSSTSARGAPSDLRAALTDGELYQLSLLEAGRYDALQAESIQLLRELCSREAEAGKELSTLSCVISDDEYNMCSCRSCCDFAVGKLDRLLRDALEYSTRDVANRFTSSLGHGDEEIIPQHLLRQMQRLQEDQLMLSLEAIELEGCYDRLYSTVTAIEKQLGSIVSPTDDRRAKLIGDEPLSSTLADSFIDYVHQLVSHTIAVRAQRMDSDVLTWLESSSEIATRIRMLSLLLPPTQ